MMASLKAEETSQMQLVEREENDEDEDLFEMIDKCKI
jgi:meiotic recombination protein DMC1